MRLEISVAAWDKLNATQLKKVCAVPVKVALGQPARIDKMCVFDHPAITEADSDAVSALIRSFNPKRKAIKKVSK